MGIFERFESVVEKGVNNVFSKVFRSGLQPVDISSALHRVMDDAASTTAMAEYSSRGKPKDDARTAVAPNEFVVQVSIADYANIEEEGLELLVENLKEDLISYADTQNYILAGPVTIRFEEDENLTTGTLEVGAETKRGSVAPATGAAPSPTHPIIDIQGEKWLLTEDVTVVGRSSKADISVDDAGVSRRHVEFSITPDGVILTDLDSTNGTFVEGHRVSAATLLDGNEITIGHTRILFWTHPQ